MTAKFSLLLSRCDRRKKLAADLQPLMIRTIAQGGDPGRGWYIRDHGYMTNTWIKLPDYPTASAVAEMAKLFEGI